MQRVKVGATGLAIVLLLIAVAGVMFRSASHEQPVAVAGASKPDVIANLSMTNATAADTSHEPMADLGVAPGAQTGNAALPDPAAKP